MSSFEKFPFPYTNPGGDGGTVMVIRHGERVDEVAEYEEEWNLVCRQKFGHCRKTFYCRVNDPPLTENGKRQAKEVATAVKKELSFATESPQVIFSSKLIRSLMTAYEIAKELSVPICVCKGFALTAAAVEKAERKGEPFSFLSMEEMSALCPGVELIDGDSDIFQNPSATLVHQNSDFGDRPRSLSDERLQGMPDRLWSHSLEYLSNWKHSVVVAHRESIRNLSGQYLNTPYCCYGIFNYQVDSGLSPKLVKVADKDGTVLFQNETNQYLKEDEEVIDLV